jgi:hypothetical protein
MRTENGMRHRKEEAVFNSHNDDAMSEAAKEKGSMGSNWRGTAGRQSKREERQQQRGG